MIQQQQEEDKRKPKTCLIICSVIHIILIIIFLDLIITTLYIVTKNERIFLVCGKKMWNLLFIHLMVPICTIVIPLVIGFFMVPILLTYTHKNPFWLFLFSVLCFIAYNATMLSMGIEYVIEAQNNEICSAALSGTHLVLLTWIFISIDSIALFIELCCLLIMLCIQGFDQNVKT